jgi:hypothetical protein
MNVPPFSTLQSQELQVSNQEKDRVNLSPRPRTVFSSRLTPSQFRLRYRYVPSLLRAPDFNLHEVLAYMTDPGPFDVAYVCGGVPVSFSCYLDAVHGPPFSPCARCRLLAVCPENRRISVDPPENGLPFSFHLDRPSLWSWVDLLLTDPRLGHLAVAQARELVLANSVTCLTAGQLHLRTPAITKLVQLASQALES